MPKFVDVWTKSQELELRWDHHESDLYLRDTPQARELLKSANASFTVFRSTLDNKQWLDIPFAYWPHLNRRKAVRHA